ncbi:Uncharacterised protein [Legionella israelensis]|nr:hypothetical protein SAMN02746069_00741 [Legionella israelensis DSM 19235]STX57480.1 Uncharacterised protein [Legionella israelensis]
MSILDSYGIAEFSKKQVIFLWKTSAQNLAKTVQVLLKYYSFCGWE